jgi:subtilisin family serine protease
MSILPSVLESTNLLPEIVIGYLSVRSQGGTPIIDAEDLTDPEPFYGSKSDLAEAARVAESSGLQIIAQSQLGIAVAGPAAAYEEVTGGQIVTTEQLMHTRSGRVEYVTHLDIVGDEQPRALGMGVPASEAAPIEAVILERPRAPQALFPSPIPPSVARFHLRVPDDVATILGASEAHRRGHLGDGVTVAMVDSGHYRHPFFAAHRYVVETPVALVPGTSPAVDPHGHGTGESANIFAVAPSATLRPYRASNDHGDLIAAMAAFVAAKADKPDVLTNSWGGDGPYPPQAPTPPPADRALVLEIRDAIAQGIIVVFSAGNGHFSIEPQVPGVIAAGGVYSNEGFDLQASTYSSGYQSPWFGGTQVPTVSGLVGLTPRAAYIMLPIPSACTIDIERASATQNDPADGTGARDGWALFSGTSAAAPQIAGAAALLRGIRQDVTPAEVSQALSDTAVDVVTGSCYQRFGNRAMPGRDLATGYGLINVSAAASLIRAD